MSRYVTGLAIPSDERFWDKANYLASKNKEYSFINFTYEDDERYPVGLFPWGLQIEFAPVTILYGNNGSGKSTILNILAEKLEIGRRSPINNSQFFSLFAKTCEVSTHSDFDEIDRRRDIITSDDVFRHCFKVRESNHEILKEQHVVIQEKVDFLNGRRQVGNLRGIADLERWKRAVAIRGNSFTKNLRTYARRTFKPASNGETALEFFTSAIDSAGVYLLDEPENSLSPSFQLKLIELLEQTSRWLGMQYIIATHSPLLLGLDGAKIINLDEEGAQECKWSELENIRILHDFFTRKADEFEPHS